MPNSLRVKNRGVRPLLKRSAKMLLFVRRSVERTGPLRVFYVSRYCGPTPRFFYLILTIMVTVPVFAPAPCDNEPVNVHFTLVTLRS